MLRLPNVLNSVAQIGTREVTDGPIDASVTLQGKLISMSLSLVTLTILSICITRRIQNVGKWKDLPLPAWLIFIIYFDSFLFVFAAALLKDIGLNDTDGLCEGAILLCLVCYMSTKILIYLFFVEKVYVVRGVVAPRRKDRLYLFNCFGMLLPYTVATVLNFVWRIAYINSHGTCIIGMEKKAMIPLIILDALMNGYLTSLFLFSLKNLYSFQHNTSRTLRSISLRTLIGSCATLASSITNMTVLMVLDGEPGWICLMCCNADILFSVLVLHWVTKIDGGSRSSYRRSSRFGTASHTGVERNNSHFRISRHGSSNPWNPPSTSKSSCEAASSVENGRGITLDTVMIKTEEILEVESEESSNMSNKVPEREHDGLSFGTARETLASSVVGHS